MATKSWLGRLTGRTHRERRTQAQRRTRHTLTMERLEDRLPQATDTFIGNLSSNTALWSDGSNWSLGVPPNEDDTAVFMVDSHVVHSYNVIVDVDVSVAAVKTSADWGAKAGTLNLDNDLTIGDFEFNSGNMQGSGKLTLNGNSKWTNGNIKLGAGGIANNGNWELDTTINVRLLDQAGTLTNHGTIKLTGPNKLDLRNDAVLLNAADGTIDFASDADITQLAPGTLNNLGTIKKTAGTGLSQITAKFSSQNGTFSAEAGTLAIASGSVGSGTLKASAGATLDLTGGTAVSYYGAFTGSGTGTVSLKDGSLKVGSGGANFNLPGSLLQWSGGIIDLTSGGTFTNAATGTITATATNKYVTGAGKFENNGHFNNGGASNLSINDGATLHNSTSGVFSFTGDSRVVKGGTGGAFNNNGLIQKTGGTGLSTISSKFNSTASPINVSTGTLALETNGGLINGVTTAVASGATLNLANFGTVDYAGKITAAGAGTVLLSSYTVRAAASGLTFEMPNTLFQWKGGTIDVSQGNVTNTKSLYVSTTGTATLKGPGSLVNQKNIFHSEDGALQLSNNAVLNNVAGANYIFRKDGDVNGATAGTFANAGLVQKTVGAAAGQSGISCIFNNTGTLEVDQGFVNVNSTLNQLSGTTLTGGTWNVMSSGGVAAKLQINSAPQGIATLGSAAKVKLSGALATFSQLAALTTNNGSLQLLSGSQLTTNGNFTNNGSLIVAPGSKLTVGGTGSFTQSSSGALTLQIGGTTAAPLNGSIQAKTSSVAGGLTIAMPKPIVGTAFTLLKNTGTSAIAGTFLNKPEGTTLVLNGVTYKLSYHGGDGNDLTLTAQ